MNPVLEKAKAAILSKADKRLHPVIEKLVEAGKTFMYDEKTRHMAIKAMTQDDPEDIGASFAGLTIILFSQAGQKPPMDAMIPAGTLLLFEALQTMEDAGAIKVDNNVLAACMQSFGAKVLELLKVTPERLQAMVDEKGSAEAVPEAAPEAPGIVAQGAM